MEAGHIFYDSRLKDKSDPVSALEENSPGQDAIFIFGSATADMDMPVEPVSGSQKRGPWFHLITLPTSIDSNVNSSVALPEFKQKLPVSMCFLNSRLSSVESAYAPLVSSQNLSIMELCFQQSNFGDSEAAPHSESDLYHQAKLVDSIISSQSNNINSLCLSGAGDSLLNIECAARIVEELPFLSKLCCIFPMDESDVKSLSTAMLKKQNKELLEYFMCGLSYVSELNILFAALKQLPNLTTLGFISTPILNEKLLNSFSELFEQPSIESVILIDIEYPLAQVCIKSFISKPQVKQTYLELEGIAPSQEMTDWTPVDLLTITANIWHLRLSVNERAIDFPCEVMVSSLHSLSISRIQFTKPLFETFISSLRRLKSIERLSMESIDFHQGSTTKFDNLLRELIDLPFLSRLSFDYTELPLKFLSNLCAAVSGSIFKISELHLHSWDQEYLSVISSLNLTSNYHCTKVEFGGELQSTLSDLQRNRIVNQIWRKTLLFSLWRNCCNSQDMVSLVELVSFLDDWAINDHKKQETQTQDIPMMSQTS
jgi:hypothetical protein